mgnify:CR=1 FL=1
MKYDPEVYKRRKNKVLKKALLVWTEQYLAYDNIRNKWDIDDRQISSLLREFTVTEILEGEFTSKWFKPWQRLSFKGIILTVLVLLAIMYPLCTTHSLKTQELASNHTEIWDNE